AAAALVAGSAAETIRIDVGANNLLDFSPESTTAAVGDVLEFHFFRYFPSHDVAMGDFDSPCTPAKTGGFYSGIFETTGSGENANVFSVVVNSTDPIFFYCTVARHCASGMVGVVNPSGSQTLATYKSNARSARSSAPPAVFGGQIVPASSS
ncbi:hypothetical protein B0T26DRAFT_627022, partial [Lasiosphaeria miniovina]